MLAMFSPADAAIIIAALVTVGVPMLLTFRRAGDARDTSRETKAQMHNNGGSSMRDAIDRIELHQARFERKWDVRFADLEERTDRIESAATKAADKAETVAINLEAKESGSNG